jgi:ParB/RepB/Spo0J family partition protein
MILVALDRIQSNPWQVRRHFDDDQVAALAADIAAHKTAAGDSLGLLQLPAGRILQKDGQPLARSLYALRGDANKYLAQFGYQVQLAYGHNRLAAFRLLVQTDPTYANMPVELVGFTDEQMATAAWSENAQRQDISPIEQAEAIKHMIDSFGWSQSKVAEQLRLSRPAVTNKLRLLHLPEKAQDAIREGAMSERQAMALLPLQELPAAAKETASEGAYYHPDTILKEAVKGTASSDDLRRSVDTLITQTTVALDRLGFPPDHAFDIGADHDPPLRAALCDECPILVKHKDGPRCPDKGCRTQKSNAWAVQRCAAATQASGIAAATTAELEYGAYDGLLYHGESLGQELLKSGCKHGNLRLRLEEQRFAHGAIKVPGFDDVVVVCAHGKGRRCKCLAKLKKSEVHEDPSTRERRIRMERIAREIKEPMAGALDAALQAENTGAWRMLLEALDYNQKSKHPDWDGRQLRAKVARILADDHWLGYCYTVEEAGIYSIRRLLEFGLEIPEELAPYQPLFEQAVSGGSSQEEGAETGELIAPAEAANPPAETGQDVRV